MKRTRRPSATRGLQKSELPRTYVNMGCRYGDEGDGSLMEMMLCRLPTQAKKGIFLNLLKGQVANEMNSNKVILVTVFPRRMELDRKTLSLGG